MVSTIRLPAAGPSMAIEVAVVQDPPPQRWRLRLALWLVRCAGRLARMSVRVVGA